MPALRSAPAVRSAAPPGASAPGAPGEYAVRNRIGAGATAARKSKTGRPECSQAASAWAAIRAGKPASMSRDEVFKTLGKCRSYARGGNPANGEKKPGTYALARDKGSRLERLKRLDAKADRLYQARKGAGAGSLRRESAYDRSVTIMKALYKETKGRPPSPLDVAVAAKKADVPLSTARQAAARVARSNRRRAATPGETPVQAAAKVRRQVKTRAGKESKAKVMPDKPAQGQTASASSPAPAAAARPAQPKSRNITQRLNRINRRLIATENRAKASPGDASLAEKGRRAERLRGLAREQARKVRKGEPGHYSAIRDARLQAELAARTPAPAPAPAPMPAPAPPAAPSQPAAPQPWHQPYWDSEPQPTRFKAAQLVKQVRERRLKFAPRSQKQAQPGIRSAEQWEALANRAEFRNQFGTAANKVRMGVPVFRKELRTVKASEHAARKASEIAGRIRKEQRAQRRRARIHKAVETALNPVGALIHWIRN